MKFILVCAALVLLVLIYMKLGPEGKSSEPTAKPSETASVEKTKPVTGSLPTPTAPQSGPRVISPKLPPMPSANAEAIQALRNNPDIKKKLEENFRKSIETSHGDFFATLPADQQEKLRAMILNHRLGLGNLFTLGGPPPEPAKLMERDRAHEDEIKKVLGEDGYRNYSEYKRTIPNRRDVSQLEEKASAMGVPLTAEQKKSVLEILNTERSAVFSKFSPENIRNGTVLPSGQNGAAASGGAPDPSAVIKAFEAEQAAADQAALSKAEGILSDSQADLLLGILRDKMQRNPPSFPQGGLPQSGIPLPSIPQGPPALPQTQK